MSQEHKVKAVLDIGGSISHTFVGAMNAVTGNITKIGATADKAIKGHFKSAINAGKKEVEGLNKEIMRIGVATAEMSSKLGDAQRRLQLNKNANQLYYNLGRATSKFAVGLATVSAEATAAGWAMFHLTEKYEDYLKSTRVGALKNDLTPQNYARLNYATGGIKDPEKMEAVMKARALFDKAHFTGSKQYLASLKAIGLAQKDLAGMTLTDAFFKVGDALKAYNGDKIAITKNLMGKGGQEALPFLMRGSKDNRERMAEADKMGLAPTDEDVQKSKEYARVMDRMQGSILGVKLALGQALLPAMERLGETMSDFMVKHHDEFAAWANKIGKAIEQNMPTMEQLEGIAHKIGAAFEFAENHTTLVKIALGALVTLPFLPFIASLGLIGTSIEALGAGAAIGALGRASGGLWGIAAVNAPLVTMIATIATLAAGYIALGSAIKEVSSNWDVYSDKSAWIGAAKNLVGMGPKTGKVTDQDMADFRKAHPFRGQRTSPLVPAVTPANTPAAGGAGAPGASSQSVNHNVTIQAINIHPSPGMDERKLAQLVAKHIKGAFSAGPQLYDGHYA